MGFAWSSQPAASSSGPASVLEGKGWTVTERPRKPQTSSLLLKDKIFEARQSVSLDLWHPTKSKGSVSELHTITWRTWLPLLCVEGSGASPGAAEAGTTFLREAAPGGPMGNPEGLCKALRTAELQGPRQDPGREVSSRRVVMRAFMS